MTQKWGKKALILVCWRRLLQRHDSNPLFSSISVQCWTLVRSKEMKLLFNSAVYFPPLVISLSSSQNFCKTRLDALTPSEPNFFSTSLACLVCLRLTVSLQEAQTRATVLPRGNVSGKPEGNCFYGSTRWGFVVETSHPLPYGFSYMLSKQSYRCPLELLPVCVALLSFFCIFCLR